MNNVWVCDVIRCYEGLEDLGMKKLKKNEVLGIWPYYKRDAVPSKGLF